MTRRNMYLSSSDDELLARTYELKALAERVHGIPDAFFTPEERASILSELGEMQPIVQELQRRGYGTAEGGCAMGLRSLFSRSSDLEPGDTIEILGLMKEARKHIIAAVLLMLATVGSALLYASIVFVVSDNRAIASLDFFVALALALPTAARWLKKQTARQKQEQETNPLPEAHMTVLAQSNGQEQATNPLPEAHMTVHGFIAHIKMHPELLPAGTTEFDLERFRKLHREPGQEAELDNWVKQLACEGTHGQHAQ